jgi:hypothetical protein
MEYIKSYGMPDEQAQKAYEDGYYIEAIQTLHGFIENQARSFLMLVGCIHFKSKQEETWDLSDTISLNDALKVLRVLNQISEEEFVQLKKFNALRNKIIHQIYKEPYEKEYLGVPKKEYDEIFLESKRQVYFFTRKCEEIVG